PPGTSADRLPLGERPAQRALLVAGRTEPRQRDRHHLAVAPRGILPLDLRLELVVRGGLRAPAAGAEQPLELAPEARVPADQRPVAVERRPPLHTARAYRGWELVLEALEDDAGVVAAEAEAVRHRDLDVGVACLVGHVVEIAGGILNLVVDRRR